MGFFSLFDSCGYIFGPAIFLAGLVALALCLWASFQPGSLRAGRLAAFTSLGPVVLGICGALFGLVFFWYLGKLSDMKAANWVYLGKVPLAGAVVAAPSLFWALVLLRVRRRSADPGISTIPRSSSDEPLRARSALVMQAPGRPGVGEWKSSTTPGEERASRGPSNRRECPRLRGFLSLCLLAIRAHDEVIQ